MKPIDQVRALLQSLPAADPNTPLSARRAAMDAFGASATMADGVALRSVELNRPAVHLTGAALRADRAILYLRGGDDTIGSPRSHQALAARIALAA